jgi:hypothetical protein
MKLFSYSPRNNQKDGLISPKINLSASNDLNLIFDIAYQNRMSNVFFQDTLKIFISTNCGLSYDYLVYQKSGDELSTLDTNSYDFVPEYLNHWRNDTVKLSSFSNEDILVKFETINRGGNNLFLDNIKIFEGVSAPLSINIPHLLDFEIYPNPTDSEINLVYKYSNPENLKITLYNSVGKILLITKLIGVTTSLNTDELSSGIYFIQLSKEGKNLTKSFMKR